MELDTITLGNAYELIKGIPDKSVDLIVTDPPYLMSYSGAGLMKTRVKHMKEAMDARTDTLLNGINEDILGEFMRIMKEPNIYIWCNKKQIVGYLDYFHKRHGCLFDFIIWGKDNPVPFTSNGYLKDKEYCLFFRKGAKVYGDYDTKHTVYMTHVNAQGGEEYGHPTMKPLHIIKNLIENSSVRGGVSV